MPKLCCRRSLLHLCLLLSRQDPPVVPFFPLVMKDLAFLHEGNKSTLDGLVNFEKLRMLSTELRKLQT